MKLVGNKTESIYRRYAIADEGSLRAAVEKLAVLHATQHGQQADPKVVPISGTVPTAGKRPGLSAGPPHAGPVRYPQVTPMRIGP